MKLAALSVDLDSLYNYAAIHGVARGTELPDLVYELAVPRFCDFARDHGIPLTFFVVGRDAERELARGRLEQAARQGHELGNHSFSHRYDLSRLPREQIEAELERANQLLCELCGERPRGFRAPGYVLSATLLAVLRESGVGYDSSLFSSPAYYLAKLVAMGVKAWQKMPSASIVDSPRVLAAKRRPHRTKLGLLELPIAVTPRLRLPYIGTSLILGGQRLSRRLTESMLSESFVNLELHGIDLLGSEDCGKAGAVSALTALQKVQPDLRLALDKKRDILSGVVEQLKGAGYGFVRLDEAARHCERQLSAL